MNSHNNDISNENVIFCKNVSNLTKDQIHMNFKKSNKIIGNYLLTTMVYVILANIII